MELLRLDLAILATEQQIPFPPPHFFSPENIKFVALKPYSTDKHKYGTCKIVLSMLVILAYTTRQSS